MRGPTRAPGLGQGLSGELARWRAQQAIPDPGKIIAGLEGQVPLAG